MRALAQKTSLVSHINIRVYFIIYGLYMCLFWLKDPISHFLSTNSSCSGLKYRVYASSSSLICYKGVISTVMQYVFLFKNIFICVFILIN